MVQRIVASSEAKASTGNGSQEMTEEKESESKDSEDKESINKDSETKETADCHNTDIKED